MARDTQSGQLRPDDCPELMGMHEIAAYSGRKATAQVYHFRNTYDDFPRPVAVLGAGPVFLAEEIREFIERHKLRKVTTRLREEQVEQIKWQLRGASGTEKDAQLAEQFGVSRQVIAAIRTGKRGTYPSLQRKQ